MTRSDVRILVVALILGFVFAVGVTTAFGQSPVYEEYTVSDQSECGCSKCRSRHTGRVARSNSTAQGVAEMMANAGYCRHFGGNSGYEGVGMGSTPEAALNNCCYSRSGMRVVDQGVAQRNGRWYACRRYAR